MPDESQARPPRRRPRGGRRRGGPPRPQQAPAQPERPTAPRGDRGVTRDRPPRRPAGGRDDRRLAVPRADAPARGRRGRRGGRGGQAPRGLDDIRPGTPCLILLDGREGEPDRGGAAAVFEGFFDFETGDPRRPGHGIPRLRIGDERLWGFECWWRVDSERGGMTDADREDLETSKRLLRGLLRDSRRSTRIVR